LQEQLRSLPVPRITTVLRADLSPSDYSIAEQTLITWANAKGGPYDAAIKDGIYNVLVAREPFRFDMHRDERKFALRLEEPDNNPASGRTWICDFAMEQHRASNSLRVRLSYRQPQTVTQFPIPRAPRLLADLVNATTVLDAKWTLRSTTQTIQPEDVNFLQDLIVDPGRTLPVILVSESPNRGPLTDVASLSRFLAGTAHVFLLLEGSAWTLTRDWGAEWSCYGGGVRCYNPGFVRVAEEKFTHRLWLPSTIERIEANSRNGFLNECIQHVFRQITARFEAFPLPSPELLRIAAAARVLPPLRAPLPPASETVSVAEQAAIPSSKPVDQDLQLNLERLREERDQAVEQLAQTRLRTDELSLALQVEQQQLSEAKLATSRAELARQEAETLTQMSLDETANLDKQKRLLLGDEEGETIPELKPLWRHLTQVFGAATTVASRLRSLEQEAGERQVLEQELDDTRSEVINLRARLESSAQRKVEVSTPDQRLRGLVPQLTEKNLPLSVLLDVIATCWPERVRVLKSAEDSALAAKDFKLGKQAFDLLWLLATEYWMGIQQGGDVEARKVFGTNYAPREKAVLSKAGTARRTFTFNSKGYFMDQHLKIGTADNATNTSARPLCVASRGEAHRYRSLRSPPGFLNRYSLQPPEYWSLHQSRQSNGARSKGQQDSELRFASIACTAQRL